MNIPTIELNQESLKRLTEGAERFGSCAILITADDGTDLYVAVVNKTKTGRKSKANGPAESDPPRIARAGANLGEAGAAG